MRCRIEHLSGVLVWLIAAGCAACADIKPDISPFEGRPRQMAYKRYIFTNSAKDEVPFVLFEPKAKVGAKRPLVLYLHPGGRMGGPRNGDHLGSAALRLADADMQEKHPCFVVAPRAIGTMWTDPPGRVARGNLPAEPGSNLRNAFELVDELLKKYKDQIDPDRIYLAGHDACGILAAAAHRPTLFAAAFSAEPEMYRDAAAALKGLPIAVVTDPKANTSGRPQKIVQELKDAGSTRVVLIESNQPATADEAFDWLFKQQRAKSAGKAASGPAVRGAVDP